MKGIKAVLIKKVCGHKTNYKEQSSEVTIEAENEEALMVLFFKKYDNGLKYCSNLNYRFKLQELKDKYRVWSSDISNYANNGGDLW